MTNEKTTQKKGIDTTTAFGLAAIGGGLLLAIGFPGTQFTSVFVILMAMGALIIGINFALKEEERSG